MSNLRRNIVSLACIASALTCALLETDYAIVFCVLAIILFVYPDPKTK